METLRTNKTLVKQGKWNPKEQSNSIYIILPPSQEELPLEKNPPPKKKNVFFTFLK